MYLDNFEKMDPIILVSIINMKLRDEFNGNLDELVKTYAINQDRLKEVLMVSGFEFISNVGQFSEKE